MSYESALVAAGATVIGINYEGSYQGTWGAIVEFNGKKGLVTGSFGSCTHCDAFQAEFGYTDPPEEKDGLYFKDSYTYDKEDAIPKEEYDQLKSAYDKRLAEFGASYLQTIWDKADVENRLANTNPDSWYDEEEKALLNWALPQLD